MPITRTLYKHSELLNVAVTSLSRYITLPMGVSVHNKALKVDDTRKIPN